MSYNLISHKDQDVAIALHNVASLYFNTVKNDELKQFCVYFTFPDSNEEERLCEEWTFDSFEEASRVYNTILDRFSNEI